MSDVKVIGRMDHTINHTFESANRVYDTEGVSLTINTCGGGGLQPKIIDTVKIKQATNKGYIECKVGGVADLSYPSSKSRRGRVQSGGEVCPTLLANGGKVCRIESAKEVGFIDKGTGKHQSNAVYDEETLSPTLTACDYKAPVKVFKDNYRIRKLTPKECWRLMGFSDEDFEKAESVNSNTQLYKQAGNSIVVDVLVEIFRNLLYEDKSKWLDDLLS